MHKCYFCDEPLTRANQTSEHILLNACGGRLKSKNLICRKCNSSLGGASDAALAKQLNYFSNILLIEREYGEPQPIEGISESTGDIFRIDSKGKLERKKPEVKLTRTDEMLSLFVRARNKSELRKILVDIAIKNPNVDVEKVMAQSVEQEEQIGEPLHTNIVIGGKLEAQSIAKTAVDFFLYKNHDQVDIQYFINSLKEGDIVDKVEPAILEKEFYTIEGLEVPHFIYLKGDRKNLILWAYVEYFGACGFIVKLNSNYAGVNFEDSYYFDVLTKATRKITPGNIPEGKFIQSFRYSTSNPKFGIFQEKVHRIMAIALERQRKNELERIINNALEHSYGKYPEGVPITKEMNDEFVSKLIEYSMPFILRNLVDESQGGA